MSAFPCARTGCIHTVHWTTTAACSRPLSTVCRQGDACNGAARHGYRRGPGRPLAVSLSQVILEEDKKDRLSQFSVETPVTWPDYPGHKLVIKALRPHLHAATAEVLTESFVETHHFKSYRQYLKQQIASYVAAQVKLLPKAVILAAVLQPPPTHLSEQQQESSAAGGNNHTAELQSQTPSHTQPAIQTDNAQDTNTSNGSGSHLHVTRGASASNTEISVRGASQQVVVQAGSQPPGDALTEDGILLGTAEVSFDRSTHAIYLTLNPPRKCAYLCNMAVSPRWRRRGVALQLVRAVEQIALDMGDTELYLHLRVKDAPATALYQSAGFLEAAADWPLIKLLGQEPRKLMRKQISSQDSPQ